MSIAVPSYITRLATTADKGIRVTIETQEISPDEQSALFALKDEFGWFVFVPQATKPEEVETPPELPTEKDEKTPSQRLRSRLFVYYKEKNNTADGFQIWYNNELDRIGNHYLDKLK